MGTTGTESRSRINLRDNLEHKCDAILGKITDKMLKSGEVGPADFKDILDTVSYELHALVNDIV